ncbi:MAG: T9SS type A sorting domain-containing protein [Chitinophagaceae bacterium]|nr:T9SS type A sorting domain-containing protein [Chitinophagaceae bacterium]
MINCNLRFYGMRIFGMLLLICFLINLKFAAAQTYYPAWGSYIDLGTTTHKSEYIEQLVVDKTVSPEEIYVVGRTSSVTENIPVCDSMIKSGGANDVFIAKLNHCGEIMWKKLFATQFISNGVVIPGTEYAFTIALDNYNGHKYVFIGGEIRNTDASAKATVACVEEPGCSAPVYQSPHGDNWDGFIAKYDTAGNLLRWIKLGGNKFTQGAPDNILAIAIDPYTSELFVTGRAKSNNMGTNAASKYDSTFNSTASTGDCFIAKFDNCLSTLEFFSYYGGFLDDRGHDIVLDTSKGVCIPIISGTTESFNIQINPPNLPADYNGNAMHCNAAGVCIDAFLMRWDSVLTKGPDWFLYFGGNNTDRGRRLALDNEGNIFWTGWTQSSNMYKTGNAFDKSYGGGGDNDAFVAKVTLDGAIPWCTYYGGNTVDISNAIIWYKDPVTLLKYAIITGLTTSTNLGCTTCSQPPFLSDLNGPGNDGPNMDAFVAKLTDLPIGQKQKLDFYTLYGGTKMEDFDNTESHGPYLDFGPGNQIYISLATKSSDIGVVTKLTNVVGTYAGADKTTTDGFVGLIGLTNLVTCMPLKTEEVANQMQAGISSYPSPFSNEVTLSIRSESETAGRIEVIDFYGKVLVSKNVQLHQGENTIHFDFDHLSAGIYMARAIFNNQQLVSKMVKQ